jgi:hypothetical protein
MSYPSLRTIAPPPCLPLCRKDSLKEDTRLFDDVRLLDVGGFLLKGGLLKGKELLKENC